ncbi:mechanosensitive ion channel protein [Novosphingobium sp. Leaf2]|nr:mechanosensitive ion channel protein [Novosphingobium sp. Leaf2]
MLPVARHVILRPLIFAALIALAAPAVADTRTAENPATVINQAERDLRDVDGALDSRVDPDVRAALRAKAAAAQDSLETAQGDLDDQMTLVDARLSGLGTPTPGVSEAPEITAQRKTLASDRAILDAAAKRAKLATVEAQQLLDEIDRTRAQQLNARLSTRTLSPLSPAFWSDLLEALPRDVRRIGLFARQGGEQIRSQWRGGIPWQAFVGAALAFIITFPVRIVGRNLGQRYLIGSAPGHRIRRQLYALWRTLIGTIAPLLGAASVVQGFRWAGLLPQRWDTLLDGFVASVGFAAFTVALSGAILMRGQPSWRVAPLTDETADRLRALSWPLGLIAFASGLGDAAIRAIGASGATTIGWQMAEALVHLVWVATALVIMGRLRALRAEREEADGITPGAGIAAATLLAWALVIGALVSLATGYVAFSLIVSRMIIWVAILGGALYLLLGTADDAATVLFHRDSRLGVTLTRSVGVRASFVDQLGVLISAVVRLVLVLLALGLAMSPFGGGEGLASIAGRIRDLSTGFEIGGVTISPGAVLRAIIVCAVGLAIVRAFMGWLEKRYLPATDLDGSARNSASLVARYVALSIVIIWALAAMGIGVERIALLLSALSVGIGFGLQAITQNFVSGLILLAERPIKIGDWVRVGTDEGDVKRISVRSTEITLPDHSTLIVPNSELITKSVLNKTLSSPLGRIQVQFSVPLEVDVDTVAGIVLRVFEAQQAIIADPAPVAYVDSIADGRIMFNCFAHVNSPREVYRTRSAVLLQLLRNFGDEGIDIGTVPQRLELAAGNYFPGEDPGAKARQADDEQSKT